MITGIEMARRFEAAARRCRRWGRGPVKMFLLTDETFAVTAWSRARKPSHSRTWIFDGKPVRTFKAKRSK